MGVFNVVISIKEVYRGDLDWNFGGCGWKIFLFFVRMDIFVIRVF